MHVCGIAVNYRKGVDYVRLGCGQSMPGYDRGSLCSLPCFVGGLEGTRLGSLAG